MGMRRRSEIVEIMRRIGMGDRVPEAERILPDYVDVDADNQLLGQLGLDLDRIVDRLGGSAW